MVLKRDSECDTPTRQSHDAMARWGHDESTSNQHTLPATRSDHGRLLSRIDDLFQRPASWDTESPKGTRDAHPSGLHQHLWVEGRRTPSHNWDTESPKGTRDAGLTGLHQHPEVDELRRPHHHRDTEAPQGPRDAGLSGLLRHLQIDEPGAPIESDTVALQGPRDAGPLGFRCPRVDESTACATELDTVLLLSSQDAGCPDTQHPQVDETMRQSQGPPHPDGAPLCQSKLGARALQTDPRNNYGQRYSKLVPDCQAWPRATTSDAVSSTPTYTLIIPFNDENLKLPRQKFPTQPEPTECITMGLYQSNMPNTILPEVPKPIESTNVPLGQSQAMTLLFHESDEVHLFTRHLINVQDHAGIKRYTFGPNYARQLTLAMQLVSSTFNDYLQAAGLPKTFSFGRSSHYDMEFSELVYRQWATRLILKSCERRVLACI